MSDGHDTTLISEWIEGDQIVLDNVPMVVTRGVGYQLSNAYGRKVQQGDPGPDDHPFNSTHTQRTWVNGCLVKNAEEAADVGNFWDSFAWTQTKGGLSAPLRVTRIPNAPAPDPQGMTVPHARLNDNFIWTKGNLDGEIYEYLASTGTLRFPGGFIPRQFSGTVMNAGVVYRVENAAALGAVELWLYIPTTAGYTRLSAEDYTTKEAPSGAAWATVGFAINENKLYRLSTSGQVHFTITHSDDPADWVLVGTIADGSDPRNIYQTYDEDGNRVIGVSTSSGLFLLDHDNAILFQTDFWFPEHAYNGYGACLFRAQDYISNGVGIQRKVGSLITQEGLDNRDGLPFPLAGGLIVDLEPSYNWLLAAIAGQLQGDPSTPLPTEELFGLTTNLPYPIVGLGTQANFLGTNRIGAIYAFNGLGWHPLFKWNAPPTRVVVSMIQNATREERQQHLFFGDMVGGAYVIQIPSTYFNPLESPTLPVERSWFLEESRIDWNIKDSPKIAKQLNIKPDHLWQVFDTDYDPYTNPTAPAYHNTIRVICNWLDLCGVAHRSDDPNELAGPGPWPFVSLEDTDEVQALRGVSPVGYLELRGDTPEANCRRSTPVGWERYEDTGQYLPTGLPHEAIWFTYRGLNDVDFERERDVGYPELNIPPDPTRVRSEQASGLIEWRTIIARKWARPNRIFTFQIDASTAIKGVSESGVMELLDRICLKVGGVPLVAGDQFYIVDVTRLDGSQEPGLSRVGSRTITCLEFTDLQYEQDFDNPV